MELKAGEMYLIEYSKYFMGMRYKKTIIQMIVYGLHDDVIRFSLDDSTHEQLMYLKDFNNKYWVICHVNESDEKRDKKLCPMCLKNTKTVSIVNIKDIDYILTKCYTCNYTLYLEEKNNEIR